MTLKSDSKEGSKAARTEFVETSYNIVIAPLNWGLGHATRCIPVIHFLLQNNVNPILASDGASLELLRNEFPQLESLELPSYGVRYSKKGFFLRYKLLLQFPYLFYTAFREYTLLQRLVKERNIDGVISDNRFGMFHKKVPSVYITHQLQVLSGSTTFLSSSLHRWCIQNFKECWIPDSKGPHSLTGALSKVSNLGVPVKYLGNLSRFSSVPSINTYKYLFILSGPEPQRSLLESVIFREFAACNDAVLVVRGTHKKSKSTTKYKHIHCVDMMYTKELEKAISSAEYVICRSGYSSVMDLAVLKKKVFFIPTPGQYEQLYLAQYLQHKGIAGYCNQDDFRYTNLSSYFQYSGFVSNYPVALRKELLGFISVK
jgi:hypothetical protein